MPAPAEGGVALHLSSLIDSLEESLRRAGIDSARVEAEMLAGHVLGLSRSQLQVRGGGEVSAADEKRIAVLAGRREKRYPLQYLTGECEFYSLAFTVREGVFIPRPETEVLVESVASKVKAHAGKALRILDIGTGSGAISISLAHALGPSRAAGMFILATDISPVAVEAARLNAARHGVENIMKFAVGDGIGFISERDGGGRFDVCVSNPPYVAASEIDGLDPEVRHHEPRAALDGGEDGLEFVRRIVPGLPSILSEGALAAFEIAPGQAHEVERLLARAGAAGTEVVKDLSGRDRVIIARMD